jgi:hypothetical protein
MLLLAADDGYWIWLERASWVTVSASLIIGLLAVSYQIRQIRFDQNRWAESQRRLADQLAKAPKILIGFRADDTLLPAKDHLTKDTAITATWPASGNLSRPVLITVWLVNAGDRSAKDLDFELRFGRNVKRAGSDKSEDYVTGVRSDGTVLHYEEGMRINPTVAYPINTRLRIPKETAEIRITAKGTMDDYPMIRQELAVRVEYRGTATPEAAPAS